ncbi:hypothetical protein CspeluHIS016_0100560 [Cutaneotrichosporon spelunceum]|uniref:F-box domain-containing protein n=1 Tax=Cutaneotrichosporon spelunceum TaxID=1672016 RepID=A0AAD3TNF6_9TREE|nr:hypothetical protein CspeluHIS016_0100560 [Cutaneotrichosporon spelunceum]
MPKRPRSPDAHPAKRSRRSGQSGAGLAPLFELDELFLRVLGHLEPTDLARVQGVSRRWAAIALDPQLWKRLYLARYPHPHHHVSVSNSSGGSTPLRPLARLPSRAFPAPSPSPSPAPEWEDAEARHDGVDWKLMLRLGTNWSNGTALSEAHVPLPPSASQGEDPTAHAQHLALFPSFICASNPTSPLVHVYAPLPGAPLGIIPPPPGWSSPHRPDCVAALAADQAVVSREGTVLPARLAILYASGGFAILALRAADGRLHWSREAVWARRSRPPRRGVVAADPVIVASLHHPVLVTCTYTFELCVYSLAAEPELLRTLRSDVGFHPCSLSVFPDRSKEGSGLFRAALTYTAPLYPSSWTIAVQELQVDIARRDVSRTEAFTTPKPKLEWPRHLSPVAGVRNPIGVGSDGRWCVLAGDGAVVYVYALPLGEGGITHVQTLLAPAAGVASIALLAGRCVCGSRDGRVLIWDLDDAHAGEEGEAHVGRIDAVEVTRAGRGRRPHIATGEEHQGSSQGASGASDASRNGGGGGETRHHPTAISHVARGLFLATPPATLPPAATRVHTDDAAAIRHLAFDEEKIVGLTGAESDTMAVWCFR